MFSTFTWNCPLFYACSRHSRVRWIFYYYIFEFMSSWSRNSISSQFHIIRAGICTKTWICSMYSAYSAKFRTQPYKSIAFSIANIVCKALARYFAEYMEFGANTNSAHNSTSWLSEMGGWQMECIFARVHMDTNVVMCIRCILYATWSGAQLAWNIQLNSDLFIAITQTVYSTHTPTALCCLCICISVFHFVSLWIQMLPV